jgi:hypothetical protein
MNGLAHISGLHAFTAWRHWTENSTLFLNFSWKCREYFVTLELAPCPFDKQQITFADIYEYKWSVSSCTPQWHTERLKTMETVSLTTPLCSYAGHTPMRSLPWQRSLASFLVTAWLIFNLAYKIIIKLIYNFWSNGEESYYFSESSNCTGQKAKVKFS